MILIAQLSALQPELKLLFKATRINCSILQTKLQQETENELPLNIGWRIVDRSKTEASPDCFLLTGEKESHATDALPTINEAGNNVYNLKEFCLNIGEYKLKNDDCISVLLEIETT